MQFFRKDAHLLDLGDQILEATWATFPTLARNQIALTWIVYDPPFPINTGGAIRFEDFWQLKPRGYSHRGVECIYPASVIKMLYMVALQEWLAKGMLQGSAEIGRAERDMIVDSGNDSTGLIVDVLTGTTSGPELSPEPFRTWQDQRNIVNRYFKGLGWPELESCNMCQKTWGDGPYGRERLSYGPNFENRNMLTTDATARVLHAIAGGVAVSAPASQHMMDLLSRSLDPEVLAADPENQIVGFLGSGLPADAKIWSKAGWMSRARHDAAYIELPDALPYTLVVFTEGPENSQNEEILPFVSGAIAQVMAGILVAA
jgi:hypothetical protein